MIKIFDKQSRSNLNIILTKIIVSTLIVEILFKALLVILNITVDTTGNYNIASANNSISNLSSTCTHIIFYTSIIIIFIVNLLQILILYIKLTQFAFITLYLFTKLKIPNTNIVTKFLLTDEYKVLFYQNSKPALSVFYKVLRFDSIDIFICYLAILLH